MHELLHSIELTWLVLITVWIYYEEKANNAR